MKKNKTSAAPNINSQPFVWTATADSLSLVPQTVITWGNSKIHSTGVSDFNEASRGSIDCVQATQRRLEQRHSLETTLVEVKDEKLMTPMYVISLAKPNDNPMK